MVEDFETFMGCIDITIFPYYFGYKGEYVINSISCGIPPVIFKSHASGELVRNGWNGFLIDNFSTGDMAEKVSLLAGNHLLRDTFSRNCKFLSSSFPDYTHKVSVMVNEVLSKVGI